MKQYYISGTPRATNEANICLWKTLWEKGKYIKHKYDGDYSVVTVEYEGKQYELWTNDELGIASMIVEL